MDTTNIDGVDGIGNEASATETDATANEPVSFELSDAVFQAGGDAANAAFDVLTKVEIDGFEFGDLASISFTDGETGHRITIDDDYDYTVFGDNGDVIDTNIDAPQDDDEDGTGDDAETGDITGDDGVTGDGDDVTAKEAYTLPEAVHATGAQAAAAACAVLSEAGVAFRDLTLRFDNDANDTAIDIDADGGYLVTDADGEVIDGGDSIGADEDDADDDGDVAFEPDAALVAAVNEGADEPTVENASTQAE